MFPGLYWALVPMKHPCPAERSAVFPACMSQCCGRTLTEPFNITMAHAICLPQSFSLLRRNAETCELGQDANTHAGLLSKNLPSILVSNCLHECRAFFDGFGHKFPKPYLHARRYIRPCQCVVGCSTELQVLTSWSSSFTFPPTCASK